MIGMFTYIRKFTLLVVITMLIMVITGCSKPENYTITFESNGGSVVESITVEEENTFLEPTAPTKEGYTFSGWYIDSIFIVSYDFIRVVTEDMTLQAKWVANEYIITLVTNGGSSISPITKEYQSEVEIAEPTKEGYSFVGWYYDSALSDPCLDQANMPASDITLYAKWEINMYTLTLEANGGSVILPITQEYGSVITYVEPIAEGYTFYGWYTDEDFLIPYDELNLKSLPATMPASDLTLYAGWIINEEVPVDCDLYPEDESCQEIIFNDVVVTFWHVYGGEKAVLLNQYILEFEALFPNITINSVSQGTYPLLENKVIMAIYAGVAPTMVVGYMENIALYQEVDALIALDDYINDGFFGIDYTDIIESYANENDQFEDGIYSLPYSKSTEVVIINSTIFEANGLTVKTDAPYTWAELDALADILVGDGPNQCEYLINFDSMPNFFITSLAQWGIDYTNTAGEILFNNANTISMLNYIQDRFDNKTFVIPAAWSKSYGSENFLAQDVCMTVSSTVGILYNIPFGGEFEVEIGPLPQYNLTNMAVIQQGPNIAILSDSTEAERLAAWLFINYLTYSENTAEWAINTSYLPVNYTGYDDELYQAFLNDPDPDYIYNSMTANVSYSQLDYMIYEAVFDVGVYSSSDVRNLVGMVINSLYTGDTPEEVLADLLSQLE